MESRVLLVDDDPQVLRLFTRILVDAGYAVHAETSSQKALDALRTAEPVDLMVLDLNMPAPDGFEVLRSMRKQRPGLRILVTSGFLDGALLEAAELLGATATLNKSDAPGLLLEKVNHLLER